MKVAGKLVFGGAPYQVEKGLTLSLSLTAKDGNQSGQAFAATVNAADGSFHFAGPNGRGIPPGAYKVSLNLTSQSSDPASLQHLAEINKQFDAFKNKEIEVTSQPMKITIDVSSGTISKS